MPRRGAAAGHRDAGGVRVDPASRSARSTTTRRCGRWSPPAPRRSASSARAGTSTSPRRCAPRSTRAWPWWRSRCAFLHGRRPAGVLRRRALLRRLQAQPRVRAPGAGGRRHQRRRLPGAVRHQRRVAAPRGAAHHRGGRVVLRGHHHRHPHPERLRVRRGQLGRRRGRRGHPRAGHRQRLRRAHRQRQPHDGHPRPDAEDGHRDAARGPHGAAHRGVAPRGGAGQPAAAPGGPLRGVLGVRPQGRPAHLGARQGRGRQLRAHRPRAWSATAPGCWCRTWAVGPACR